jgi:hypothetical protein
MTPMEAPEQVTGRIRDLVAAYVRGSDDATHAAVETHAAVDTDAAVATDNTTDEDAARIGEGA